VHDGELTQKYGNTPMRSGHKSPQTCKNLRGATTKKWYQWKQIKDTMNIDILTWKTL